MGAGTPERNQNNFGAIENVIDMGYETGEIMAQAVTSTYWGHPVSLKDLKHFDKSNFALALEVISYRRTPGWGNNEFFVLAQCARARLAPESACGDKSEPRPCGAFIIWLALYI